MSEPAPSAPARRGNVFWLSAASFLNDAASEMIYPLLPLFLTGTLRAGPAVLGVVEGVTESAASVLKLLGGRLADRTGRRKPLVVWGYAIAALVRPLIAVAAVAWHVLAVRLADRVGKGLRTAPRDALLAESVPEDQRGAAFGIHRAADHAGAVVGPLIAAALLLLWPGELRLVFALALVPGLLTVLVVALRVRETRRASSPADGRTVDATEIPGAGAASSRDAGRTSRPDADAVGSGDRGAASAPSPRVGRGTPRLRDLGPTFPRYLAVLLLFTLGNATDAFLLVRAAELGVATALVPVLWSVLHVSKMAWSVVGGRWSDRVGARRAIVTGWLVYAAVYAGFAAAGEAWHAWALFAAYGLFFGLTEAPEKALVAQLAPAGLRGSAFGAYHAAIGLGALPASLLFGWLWQTWSAATAFTVGAGLALAAALLLPLALPRGPHPAR